MDTRRATPAGVSPGPKEGLVGTDPLMALNRVRELRGHDPINPYRIDGEAALTEEERSEQDLIAKMAGDEVGPGVDERVGVSGPDGQASPPSPLIPPPIISARAEAPQPAPANPVPDFVVVITRMEALAGYKGHDVMLNESDIIVIRNTVLNAFQRNVLDQVKLDKGVKARRRKPAVKEPGGTSEGTVEAVASKRLAGRPIQSVCRQPGCPGLSKCPECARIRREKKRKAVDGNPPGNSQG